MAAWRPGSQRSFATEPTCGGDRRPIETSPTPGASRGRGLELEVVTVELPSVPDAVLNGQAGPDILGPGGGRPGDDPARSAAGPDPFDPMSLRLADQLADLKVAEQIKSVPVRRPDKSWFIRVHPGPDYRLQTKLIVLKDQNEIYLVRRDLWAGLEDEPVLEPRQLVTAINRQGVLFLWP